MPVRLEAGDAGRPVDEPPVDGPVEGLDVTPPLGLEVGGGVGVTPVVPVVPPGEAAGLVARI
jgi:hypothetical protein